jgi:hypothetical protein
MDYTSNRVSGRDADDDVIMIDAQTVGENSAPGVNGGDPMSGLTVERDGQNDHVNFRYPQLTPFEQNHQSTTHVQHSGDLRSVLGNVGDMLSSRGIDRMSVGQLWVYRLLLILVEYQLAQLGFEGYGDGGR